MNQQETRELARLLTGHDGPSVVDIEQTEVRILRTATTRDTRRFIWVGCAAAAVATIAIVVALYTRGDKASATHSAFRARGQHTFHGTLTCARPVLDTQPIRCRKRDTLAFTQLTRNAGYLSAFTIDAAGHISWFWPQAHQAHGLALVEESFQGTLKRGIPLHSFAPGQYTVVLLWSATPMRREALKTQLARDHIGSQIEVVERSLHIVGDTTQ